MGLTLLPMKWTSWWWDPAGHVTDANAGIEAKDRGAPLEIRDAAGILKPDAGQQVQKVSSTTL